MCVKELRIHTDEACVWNRKVSAGICISPYTVVLWKLLFQVIMAACVLHNICIDETIL